MGRLAYGLVSQHLRCNENQHFLFVGHLGTVLEQVANTRQISQQGHLGLAIAFSHLENTTDHDGAAVLNQHLSLNVLGVNG